MMATQQHSLKSLLVASVIFATSPVFVAANPNGANVVTGDVSISESDGTLKIVNSDGSIIDWESFNIAEGELTEFLQANPGSRVLNRVVGSVLPTEINGELVSNGTVFLIDANGIAIGKNGSVDTNGLVLSTLDISNSDFSGGRLQFTGNGGNATVVNNGRIRSTDDIYLVGGNTSNNGSISSRTQNVLLAAGDDIFIEIEAGDLIAATAQGDGSVTNSGSISAPSGAVGLLAAAIDQSSGTISSDRLIISADGRIEISDNTAPGGADGGTDGATDGGGSPPPPTDGGSTDGTGTDGTGTDGTGTDGTGTDGTGTDGGSGSNPGDGDGVAIDPPAPVQPPASSAETTTPDVVEVVDGNGAVVSGSVSTGGTGSSIVTGGAGADSSVPTENTDPQQGTQIAAVDTSAQDPYDSDPGNSTNSTEYDDETGSDSSSGTPPTDASSVDTSSSGSDGSGSSPDPESANPPQPSLPVCN